MTVLSQCSHLKVVFIRSVCHFDCGSGGVAGQDRMPLLSHFDSDLTLQLVPCALDRACVLHIVMYLQSMHLKL